MKVTNLIAASAIAVAATAAPAVAQDAITEFRIGILGGENAADRLKNNECVRAYTEELLGVPTKIFAPADYDGVIQGLLGGNLDMAWLGASSYAKVYLDRSRGGSSRCWSRSTPTARYGYYSVGFARVDSGIASLDDMQGKVFGFGDPNSTSGYLIPSIEIPKLGYSMEPGDYFGDVTFTGGHEQTIVAVANGDIDAGVTWADGLGEWEEGYNSGALRKAVDAGLVDMTQLVQIWQSPVIPEGPIVLRKSLPEDVKIKMTGMLASLASMDQECAYTFMSGEVLGIAPIDHSAYETIIAARKAKSQ